MKLYNMTIEVDGSTMVKWSRLPAESEEKARDVARDFIGLLYRDKIIKVSEIVDEAK